MRRTASVVAVVVVLTGCATYSLIEPRRTAIGRHYTVEPQMPWSSATVGKIEVWTVDGPSLQAMRFVKGLQDGEVLLPGKDEDKRPKFKKSMTPTEIMEFVVDSIALAGGEKVRGANLRPQKIGAVEGFRFELSFIPKGGLENEGMVMGAVVKEQLHLIMYTGVRAHFYSKFREPVERVIESIRWQ